MDGKADEEKRVNECERGAEEMSMGVGKERWNKAVRALRCLG